MKKIINGKLYDTETANELCTGTVRGDYDCFIMEEHLYKKTTGEYFLFREMVGDGDMVDVLEWVMAHRVQPLSIDKVKQWLELNEFIDVYEQEFGLPEE